MTRVFKPMDFAEQTAFITAHCRLCKLQLGCTILAEARPRDAFDPDYPSELVYDDDNRPTCTDFQGPGSPDDAADLDSLPPVIARPVPPLVEVVALAVTTIGRGAVEAIRLRPGKRSWTVPYSSVAELFDDGGPAAEAMRAGLGVPTPEAARVHRGPHNVTITARSARDGASVTSSVRLKLAGGRR